jgi:hypothetical protein
MQSKNKTKLVAVVQYGEGESRRSRWIDIGVAFENRDGSWNLFFDFLPTELAGTTIQMRPFQARSESQARA